MNKYVSLILEKPPRNDITFKQLTAALESLGFRIKSIKGSHVKFVHPKYKDVGSVIVPKPHGGNKEVKDFYIKRIQEIIEVFLEQDGGDLWIN